VEEGFRPTLENSRKIWHRFSFETEKVIKRQNRGDARRPNGPWWRGLGGGPRHPCSFGPRGLPRVISVLQLLLVHNY
jgi:hypothetical protein